MKKGLKCLLFTSITLLFITACSNFEKTDVGEEEESPEIVTSIFPVYALLDEIAGDRAEVSLMVGENEDAHHYEPSAKAVAAVNEADMFVYSSDVMEFWAKDLLSVIENDQLVNIKLADDIDLALNDEPMTKQSDKNEGEIVIEGLADHYHTGDSIELTAIHDSNHSHWHWFTRENSSEEWQVVEDQLSNTFSSVATTDEREIKAELYDDDHQLVASTEPIIITIDDHTHTEHNHENGESHHHDHDHSHTHEAAADVEQTIKIEGLAGHYHTGDLIELTASHNSNHSHWHWSTRESPSEEWQVVEDQLSNTFSSVATTDGLEIKAELYDDNHQLVASSEPVTITIDDHESHHNADHSSETLDPHFWLNPVAVNKVLPKIVEALSEIDPEGAEIYQKNADDFSKEIKDLDNAYQEAFDGASNRSFVVQHQAFGHLAEQYDLEQVSVGSMITEIEPNPQSIINVTKFVKENNIPVIYYQDGENSSTAETIANETGTEVAILYDLESQPSIDNIEDNIYIEAMYHNLEQLKKSIQ